MCVHVLCLQRNAALCSAVFNSLCASAYTGEGIKTPEYPSIQILFPSLWQQDGGGQGLTGFTTWLVLLCW